MRRFCKLCHLLTVAKMTTKDIANGQPLSQMDRWTMMGDGNGASDRHCHQWRFLLSSWAINNGTFQRRYVFSNHHSNFIVATVVIIATVTIVASGLKT